VLVAGFCVLSVSAFQVNHGMGQLTGLVLLCALVADFLMLPGLLIMAARRGWA
jgi:predicted RND superfamily exporter protein